MKYSDGTNDLFCRKGGMGLIDVFRTKHPKEKTAYTCFNNRLNARTNNFGTRIDYILCDDGMKGMIEASEILSEMKGSDHLPVVADFAFTPNVKEGLSLIGLREKFGRQQKIHHFFSRRIQPSSSSSSTTTTTSTTNNNINSPLSNTISNEVAKETKEDEKEEGWSCAICTYRNSLSKKACEICRALRRRDRRTQSSESKQDGEEEIAIDHFFGGKRVIKTPVPLCSGHQLPCVRRQGKQERFIWISLCSNKGRKEQRAVLLLLPSTNRICK